MIWRLLADLVLLIHLGFILFVVFGGLLALWRPRLVLAHLPVVTWGIAISFGGWVCPLTPLENLLRERGGEAGYHGSFIDQYLVPLIYPAGLTPHHQFLIATGLLLLNTVVYVLIWRRWRQQR